MMNRRFLFLVLASFFFACTVTSCARGKEKASRAPAEAVQATESDSQEGALRAEVRRTILAAASSESEGRGRLISRKPHHYKEYVVYPDGGDSFELEIREQTSRTAPFSADVTVRKNRFATRIHRNRKAARDDNSFIRTMGTETASYEMRNGKWRRIGSLFVADRREELVNGEWVPALERAPEVFAPEEPERGFFGRAWDTVRFWR